MSNNQILSYKCPSCGGGMKFHPGKGFKCEYCLSVFTQEQLDAVNVAEADTVQTDPIPQGSQSDQTAGAAAQPESESEQSGEAVIYSCPNCGAEVITDATTAATSCHYCHNPVVLSGKLSGEYKPDVVIPFVLTKEQAAEQFRKHCQGRFFLPRNFYSEEQIQNLYGVYYPYWIVDSEVSGSYTAKGEVERVTRQGDDRIIHVTVYDVERDGDLSLRDMTGSAIKNKESEILDYILPFELGKAQPFSMTYLSGFRAEKRNLEKKDLQPQIEETKKDLTLQLLRQDVGGYSRLFSEAVHLNTNGEQWRYALLPVWVVTYCFGEKIFMYGVNGQTGKAFGELPVNRLKLTLVSIAAGIAAAVLAFFVLMMLGGSDV
ncbi:MAG: TFIIB-type zinc ribbon-containing protein [Ruminococcaceae bacterium]|nr:TFIIB-type zinc ribbon-containing protein [Oscillospiraceae bacterium]